MEEEEGCRKSKDSKKNKKGETLLDFIRERGWFIMNGCTEGDEDGEWTYIGPIGESVIDYILGGERITDDVKKMEIGDNVDSEHHPIIVWIKGKEETENRRLQGQGRTSRGI